MVSTRKRGVFWLSLAVSVAGAVAAVHLLPRAPSVPAEAPAAAERTRVAAIRRIVAESAGTSEPRSVAALAAAAAPAPRATPPTPPAGYAFTTFHQLTSSAWTPPDTADDAIDPAPPWLAAGEAGGSWERLAVQAARAGRDWAFGWLRRAGNATRMDIERALEPLGARVVGASGELLRARLPGDLARLGRIARLPVVSGVGALPSELKAPARFAEEALARPPDERAPVFVTLMEDDRDGRWRSALEGMGAQVGWFDADTRAYAANVPYGVIEQLTAADFVLAVEPVGRVEAALSAAAPAMSVDALRTHDAGTGLFSGIGGASVPIGVMDTGLNINHLDIRSNRRSVCGANFEAGTSPRQEDQDLWFDSQGHGTHVTGILVGNGTVDPRRAGMAPLVRDIRFAKVLHRLGDGNAVAWSRAQDWLSRPTACGSHPAVKPLVLNSSVGVGAKLWEARTLPERKLDAVIWRARQLYAISAGNDAKLAFVNYAAAKNTLSVGAVGNNGVIADFSSRGPTGDGRLHPHVVGTGMGIAATRGGGSEADYVTYSGTSMASPAVAGVAALIMDGVPELRERPAAVRALLMASAIKPDAFFERRDLAWLVAAGRGRFRLDNGDGPGALQHAYGLGKASARASVLARDAEDGWVSGAAEAAVSADSVVYQDIVVPPGASRLDVVLTWDEPAAETIAPPVLNDLDLWIDHGVTCPPSDGACGDRASRSQVDNVEWVILPNPPPGTYRLKAVPRRVFGPARAGLAWTVIRGPSTPQLAVAAQRPVIATPPNRAFDVDLTLSVDGYVATGATLRVDCRARPGSRACSMVEFIVPQASSATREDGLSRSLDGESSAGIALGEIGAGEQQQVTLRFKARPEADSFRLHFTATAWNGAGAATSVAVRVGDADDAAPRPADRPPNDDFANAAHLTGERGKAAPVHILLATAEPGEPVEPGEPELKGESEPPSRSVWYRWTAPTTGPARFTIARGKSNDLSDAVSLALYGGERIVSLKRLAPPKLGGGMTFFAEAGATYAIRLGLDSDRIDDPAPGGPKRHETLPITLHWAPGDAPVNDDFAAAIALGDAAAIEGNNQGASLELGELVGQDLRLDTRFQQGAAASVWYRWTAPTTADWRFAVDRRHLRVLAFVGDDVASARLVSGGAARHATFPARAGEEYRIAVVAENAAYGGTDYRLSWSAKPREGSPHDDFAAAEPIVGPVHSGRFDINVATVEPGEPIETGTRTAWWRWEAAADGEFTWRTSANRLEVARFGELEVEVPAAFPMRFAAFSGETLATLTPLAVDATEVGAVSEVTFKAKAGQRYWFSIGLPRDAALAAVRGDMQVRFSVGPTPGNDSLADAIALAGAAGAVSGSNEFATVERGERTGVLGDSSVWWTWRPPEADADAWYRFVLAAGSGVIAIYKRVGAGLELVTRSNGALARHEAVFQAERGVEYVIRLGAVFDGVGENQSGARGEFELRWEVNGPPVWLRYAGRIFHGQVNEDGVALRLDSVVGGAVNGDGTLVYANTVKGLRVFQRDPATGALTLIQALAPVGPTPAAILWDDASDSLITASCEGWRRFRHGADGAGPLEHAGAFSGDSPCPDSWNANRNHTQTARSALLAPGGGAVHIVHQNRAIDTYTLDMRDSVLALVDTVDGFEFQDVAAHGDGEHLYALATDRLLVLRRDADSDALSVVHELRNGGGDAASPIDGLTEAHALAIDKRNRHLFVLSERGLRALAFELGAHPARPRFLGGVRVRSGPSARPILPHDQCFSAAARDTSAAVDVFCSRFAYSVQVRPDGSLRQTEFLAPTQKDRFGRNVPYYDSGCMFGCVSTPPTSAQIGLASPDGKHIYAIYAQPGVMIFERFGGS